MTYMYVYVLRITLCKQVLACFFLTGSPQATVSKSCSTLKELHINIQAHHFLRFLGASPLPSLPFDIFAFLFAAAPGCSPFPGVSFFSNLRAFLHEGSTPDTQEKVVSKRAQE